MNRIHPLNFLLGIVGGAIGGVVGFFLFKFLLGYGMYALAIPGSLLGVGCGIGMRQKSNLMGGICLVAGACLGLFTEWNEFPMNDDPGFGFFLTHVYWLKPVTWIMLILGAVVAFWFGRGREQFVSQNGRPE